MKIYYSGNEQKFPPEKVVNLPNVMLSFAFLNKKKGDMGSQKRLKRMLNNKSAGSIFLDSGAFSLYTREAKKGKNMAYYSLKAGSEFRHYCDRYARFILKKWGENGGLIHYAATVDVIYDPKRTFETMQYFYNEHGLADLIPVVHFGSELKWIGKYIERGHSLIGLGGFAWGGQGTERWLDHCFNHTRNVRGLKLHGFALTGWDSITRWPWYSVDSTSWILTAAFGGIIIPQRRGGKWVYDEPPYVISISDKAGSSKMRFQTMTPGKRQIVLDWLKLHKLTWEEVSGKDNEKGADPSYGLRAKLNLIYFETLQRVCPKPKPRMTMPGLIYET